MPGFTRVRAHTRMHTRLCFCIDAPAQSKIQTLDQARVPFKGGRSEPVPPSANSASAPHAAAGGNDDDAAYRASVTSERPPVNAVVGRGREVFVESRSALLQEGRGFAACGVGDERSACARGLPPNQAIACRGQTTPGLAARGITSLC